MKEIKTKSTVKDIKIIDKSTDVIHRMKNAFIRTREQAEQTHAVHQDGYVQDAEDQVQDSAASFLHEAEHAAERHGRKAVQKLKERRSTTSSPEKKTALGASGKAPEQHYPPARVKQAVQQKTVPANTKYTLVRPGETAKGKFVLSRTKKRFAKAREIRAAGSQAAQTMRMSPAALKSVYQPADTILRRSVSPRTSGRNRTIKQSARTGGKAAKTTKGTIKTAQKTVKTTERSVKAAFKTPRTAAKTAQAAAQNARRTAQASRAAAKAALVAAKTAAKAVVLAVKASIAAVKGLVALLAAGGGVALVVILVICLAGFLLTSVFGVFLANESYGADTPIMAEAINRVNEEFATEIRRIQEENPHDKLEISDDVNNVIFGNWREILAVYAVRVAADPENGMEVVTLDDAKEDILRDIFWEMTAIDHWLETITHTETEIIENEDGTFSEITTVTYEYILHITVTGKTARQQAADYGFAGFQAEMLDELLKSEYDRYFLSLIAGVGYGAGVVAEGIYIWPSASSNYVTSSYGMRLHPVTGVYHFHNGIDIGAGYGTAVLAAADGTVTTATYDAAGYGHYLVIDHGNGNRTIYAHMSITGVNAGQTVLQGQIIGLVGSTGMSTGPHLHFETYLNNARVDPLLFFSNYLAAW